MISITAIYIKTAALVLALVFSQSAFSLNEGMEMYQKNRMPEAELMLCAMSIPAQGLDFVVKVEDCARLAKELCELDRETMTISGPPHCAPFLPFLAR